MRSVIGAIEYRRTSYEDARDGQRTQHFDCNIRSTISGSPCAFCSSMASPRDVISNLVKHSFCESFVYPSSSTSVLPSPHPVTLGDSCHSFGDSWGGSRHLSGKKVLPSRGQLPSPPHAPPLRRSPSIHLTRSTTTIDSPPHQKQQHHPLLPLIVPTNTLVDLSVQQPFLPQLLIRYSTHCTNHCRRHLQFHPSFPSRRTTFAPSTSFASTLIRLVLPHPPGGTQHSDAQLNSAPHVSTAIQHRPA